jgi:hypothetical protein
MGDMGSRVSYAGAGGLRWVKARLWQGDGAEVSKALPFETEASARERLADRLYLHLSRPEEAADVRLTASADVSGGELWVDGKAQGAFAPGLELTVKAGEHAFEVRRDGKALAEAKAMAKAGTTTELALAAVFRPRTDIPIEFPDPPPHVVPPPAPRRSAWPWVAGGVGAAGLVGAGVFYALRQGKESDLDKLCGADPCPSRVRDDIDRSKLYGTLSVVSLGVGVAGVATSAALFLTESKRRDTAGSALRVHGFVLPQPGGGAAALVGSF